MAKKCSDSGFKRDKKLIVNLSPYNQNTLGGLAVKALRKALEVVGANPNTIGEIISRAIPSHLLTVKILNRHFLTLWGAILDRDELKKDPIAHASEVLRTIIGKITSEIGKYPSKIYIEDEKLDTDKVAIIPVNSEAKESLAATPEILPAVKDYKSDYENGVLPGSYQIPESVLARFKALQEEADRKFQKQEEQEIMEEATV